MAKKKTRKSRKARRRREQVAQPTPAVRREEPAPRQEPPKPVAARTARSTITDFVHEYAYVYFDLRKMFTLALAMFILLVVTNLILTQLLTF